MPLLNRNRMSLIVGLGELQTFSFRFTQRLNMFCFELTGRLLRVNTFFSLTHGFQLNSYDAPVATSASNSSKRLDTSICCVCVCVSMRLLNYLAKWAFFFPYWNLVQKRTEGNCQYHSMYSRSMNRGATHTNSSTLKQQTATIKLWRNRTWHWS